MIPKKIFQTWKTKELSPDIQKNVDLLCKNNPQYEYQLFDDQDCLQYLQEHYGDMYVRAFNNLRSGAFKADLWRYAVLYREGGVYIDLDMKPLVPLDSIISPDAELVSSIDRRNINIVDCAIYQAFIACKPNHPALYHALQLSLYNILSYKIPDTDCIDITGPIVFGRALNLYWNKDTEEKIDKGIYDNGKIVLYSIDNSVEYMYNLQGRKIIHNKIPEYSRGHLYWTFTNNYYKNKPKRGHKYELIDIGLYKIFFQVCICIILLYTVIKIIKNCKNE